MNLTNYIQKETKLQVIQEPSNDKYTCFNTGGVESEVGEFLYGLVRAIKPENILETGTHKGIASSYMALALKENNKGHLDTIEFDPQHYEEDYHMWDSLTISNYITLHEMKSENFVTDKVYDLVLLDTEPDIRFEEFIQFYNSVKPGGIIIIHDLHPHLGLSGLTAHGMEHFLFGDFRKYLGDFILKHEVQVISLPTPRGITIFQKTAPDFSVTKHLKGEI